MVISVSIPSDLIRAFNLSRTFTIVQNVFLEEPIIRILQLPSKWKFMIVCPSFYYYRKIIEK